MDGSGNQHLKTINKDPQGLVKGLPRLRLQETCAAREDDRRLYATNTS
jgi:hypothetical protein